jgi:hypothetical protein
MQIDVTAVLVGFDGKAIQEPDPAAVKETADNGAPGPPRPPQLRDMLLRSACTQALMTTGKSNPEGEEKLRRFMLARRIHEEGKPSFTVEEVALLKKLIGEFFIPNVVGAAWTLLEGEEELEKS